MSVKVEMRLGVFLPISLHVCIYMWWCSSLFSSQKRTDRHINHRRGARHTAQEATKLARARSLRREKALA